MRVILQTKDNKEVDGLKEFTLIEFQGTIDTDVEEFNSQKLGEMQFKDNVRNAIDMY